ncbi:Type I Iterative PKS [Knufia fluminis]|uniref:Type I Iterative PKS n=1 Tax=Knufia fluminis TaxID=191047 RepID=A0AAN8FF17_9EURO|nr:Type I Iterative PKS [Knufia fluminis]
MGSISTEDSERHCYGALEEPLAIIGLSTRFPQEATDTEELWKFLLKGRSAHTPFPADRIGPGHYHPDPEHGGSFAVKGGHFLLEDPALFDAPFFSVTKGEVMALDPQQRVVLENVYHALENSGLAIRDVTGSNTSVFVSGFNHDHLANLNTDPESTMKYKPTGTTNSLLSNRVSWFFDFKSPSVTLDTACSSSMVALHLGCQGLRTGESDMAIISGVTMISFPTDIMSMGHHGFLSTEGKSFSFDHRAEGYARGEGVGSLIVKRLPDAVRDGNTIRAVIRGTGVNQDGRTPGIAMPSSAAQESLMRKVYASAKLDFEDTMMVEAHGTGTAAGDPLEASAIAKIFQSSRSSIPMIIGAIKSGIGHLEGGAGIAGLIKAILILERGIIPPNVNFEKVNPKIPWRKWKLQFPTKAMPWPTSGLRRISVNSFGVGGTNAHTILDDAFSYLSTCGIHALHRTNSRTPTQADVDSIVESLNPAFENELARPSTNGKADGVTNGLENSGTNGLTNEFITGDDRAPEAETSPRLVVVTSFDEAGVHRNGKQLSGYLKSSCSRGQNHFYLDDLAYTLAKRSRFPWRAAVQATTVGELANKLDKLARPVRAANVPQIGFVFTGQGAQWHAMGRELLVYTVFRQSLLDASNYMQSIGSLWSLFDELCRSKADTNVNEPYLTHPACTALQIALTELLASWHVVPSRVVGHSSGEIAAAYCAGKLSREAAWKTAYLRGLVSDKQLSAKGSMMAVGLSAKDVEPYVSALNDQAEGKLIIACYNSPRNVTVSGDDHRINRLKEQLSQQGVFARKLLVKNAYHSSHMQEVADEYLKSLGHLSSAAEHRQQQVHMFSSVTGSHIGQHMLDAQYWVDNLVSPVRFEEALRQMCFSRTEKGQASIKINASAGNILTDVIIEIGPHAALQSTIKETLAATSYSSTISTLSTLNRSTPGLATILDTIGHLVCKGAPLDLSMINQSTITPSTKHRSGLLVDLPGYAFDHSEKLIYESRLAKNYRLRKEPRHDLFGAPVSDWNPEMPRWRNIIRISEQPWLRDHMVTNQIVLPGVAYLIAAIEASRQIASQDKEIVGFRLKDISLKRALIVPDNKEGVETMLSLTRFDESSLQASSVWRKFSLSSFSTVNEDWTEHCTGYIAVDYEEAENPIDEGHEAREEASGWARRLEVVDASCTVLVDIDDVYDNLVTSGLAFGPLFRNLSDVKCTTNQLGETSGTVTVPDVASAMPKKFMHDNLIHPATMDSFMHFFLSSALDAMGKATLDRPMVPTFIRDVWVSAELQPNPGHRFRGHGKSSLIAYDKYESDVRIWDFEGGKARVLIQGIRATPLESVDLSSGSIRKLNHGIEWTPYLELATDATFASVARTTEAEDAEYRTWVSKFQIASLLLINDALDELNHQLSSGIEGHMLRYFEWMQYMSQLLQDDQISGMRKSDYEAYHNSTELKAQLFKEVEEHNADGALALRMGRSIVKVLNKEDDPLHLMFGIDDLLDHVYAQVAHLGDLPALQAALLEIVAKTHTGLKVLEVGAGTGGLTVGMLEGLIQHLPDGGLSSSVGTYTFTDISAAFFEKAREKFKAYHAFLEYKVLDIEQDPDKQGLDVGTYDIVIAQNVVHATKDLKQSFQNTHKLLKPGGKLLLQEGVRQDFAWSTIAFGQLPGWWAGVEPNRKMSPWIPSDDWDNIIKSANFTGIDLELSDRRSRDLHTQSLFVATALPAERHTTGLPSTAIVTTIPPSEGLSELCSSLKTYLESKLEVDKCSVIHYLDLAQAKLDSTVCISICELERPVLVDLQENEFNNIRQMLCICKGMIWVTGDIEKQPEYGMITGMTRTCRWERDIEGANLTTLAISEPRPDNERLVDAIGRLYQQQFNGVLPEVKYQGEFLLKENKFLTSRLVEAPAANEFLHSQFARPKPVMTAYKDAGRPIKLATSAPGLLDKLEWVTDEIYLEPLADTHVEIDIRAAAMNFRDLMIAMGEHMAYSMGNEAAGMVTRVGTKVTDVKVGDRVVYLCGVESTGCFHTFGRVDQNVVVKIPDQMSYEVACGLPCVYATVIYGLVDAGRLAQGEKILIHAAAGGVGQAAIHYAKYVGAEIFATVSSPEKKELVMRLGVQEDHIFSSRDLTFVKGVMRMTEGKGVDLVLNSLSGEALRRSWDLLAPFGRFIEIGKKDAQNNGKIELRPFLRNVTMASVELPTMMRHRPSLFKRLTEDTVRLWSKGHIKEADPLKIMNFSQVEEGLRVLQSGKGMGKMVFVPTPDDMLPIVPPKPPTYHLRADATYILAGGLGGIGRSAAKWMAKKGARHLLFLSSTGNVTEAVSEMMKDLQQQNCEAKIKKCDVSDKAALQATINECSKTMPPIRGVIQGAMKLKDTMLENMTHTDFTLATNPKVHGSRNLHDLLPQALDFFIMLSSATGILGNRAQANYAAGNTYQDSLAHHRRSLGLPATTIDLGQVQSVGYVAENKDRAIVAKHLATVLEVIREDEIHALLEYAMNPANSAPAQLITGLSTMETYRARGAPPPTYLSFPLFTHLNSVNVHNHTFAAGNTDNAPNDPTTSLYITPLLRSATTLNQATEIVTTAIRHKLAALLAVEVENIETGKSVAGNGVDSLVAMEFRTYLVRELGCDVPVVEIQGCGSVAELGRRVVQSGVGGLWDGNAREGKGKGGDGE